MPRPRAIVLRAPGTNCDEETAAAWERAGADGRDLARRPAARGARRARRVPDPDHPRRLLLRRRPRRRPDPRHAAGHGPGRRPPPVPRPRRLILGICNGFQVLVKAGLLPGGHGAGRRDADAQRLGPFRGALGPAGPDARPLPVPRPTPSRSSSPSRTARGSSSLADPAALAALEVGRAGRPPLRRRRGAVRPRTTPPIPTARPAPWPGSATRPAGSSA